jgi:putative ABC transport system permease protein
MFRLILRKIARNKWLFLSLVGGAVVAVAMVASVPLYTDGILQRMLSRDLEQSQAASGEFPGRYTVRASYYDPMVPFVPAFVVQDRMARGEWIPSLGLPVLAWTNRLALEALDAVPVPPRENVPKSRILKLEAAQGAADHIRITHGRLYSSSTAAGVIEVVVTEQAFADMDLRLDEAYEAATLQDASEGPLRFRVVGIYEPSDPHDIWWYQPLWNYGDCLLADYALVRSAFADPQTRLLTSSTWSYALDYHAIRLGNLGHVVTTLEGQIRHYQDSSISYLLPMLDVLRDYDRRQRQLLQTLWFLQIPVLIMLGFYLCMVSLLIVGTERNEIAVLKSRGAGGTQIFLIYGVESLLIAGVACAVGPPLGLLICRVIGASSGFLEFVHRAPLPIPLSARSFLYGAAGAGILLAALIGPAVAASQTTIVQHKRALSRGTRAPLWKRLFLDLVLLALAGYGYSVYRSQKAVVVAAGTMPLDPIVVLVSTFFILGVGLLFLRVYPAVLRLVFLLGRRVWPPWLYAPLLHVGRCGGAEQLVMLFLILTLANGVLDARFARTIDRNVQDKIQYFTGADITLQEAWPSTGGTSPGSSSGAIASLGTTGNEPIVSHEPDFSRYRSLAGADRLTRVLRKSTVLVDGPNERMIRSSFMAVVPDEFGEVAWFRPGLLPYHWNQYLNLLTLNPGAFLVSQSFADHHHIKLGNTLTVTWSGQGNLDGIVFAFVPYWPTYNPWDAERREPAQLVVGNLSYVQAKMRGEPYEVWIKKAPGATSAEIYKALEERQIPIARLTDATPALVAAKNDALLQGINGALTMAFVAAMAVCLTGSLIAWILSFQGRILQFGVFRAIGLSRWSVIGMIVVEQALTSAAAIALGIVTGGVAADLFVPLLTVTQAAGQQVPPFRVSAASGDYVRLYTVIAAMLAIGLGALGVRVARLGITRALKLGEE